jgi:hypothetical protein
MISIKKLKVGLVAFLFLSLAGTPLAWADVGDPDSPWKRLTLKGGYFFATQDSTIRLDGPLGNGTSIDVEEVLGLDENIDSYEAGIEWRFFDRHRLSVTYFDLSRDATTELTVGFTWDDQPFSIGIPIQSEYKWNTAAAFYTWSFLQTNKYEVGLDIGAHITTLKLSVFQPTLGLRAETKSVTAPLPILGLRGTYAFTPKLQLKVGGGWFGIKIDDVEGSQWVANFDLEYNMWKHVGFGLGYRFYNLDVDVTDDDFRAQINSRYHGLSVFLKLYL